MSNRLVKILKERYLWGLIALFVAFAAYIYSDVFSVIRRFVPFEAMVLTHVTVEHVLFLSIVSLSSYKYEVKGGVIASLAAWLLIVIHSAEQLKQPDIWLSLVFILCLGIIIAWLIGNHVRDSNAQRQTLSQLMESEDRYRALINLGTEAGEAIVMLQDIDGVEGAQTFASDQWLRITGYQKDEIRNMSFFDLISPKDLQASVERHRKKMMGQSVPGLFELFIIRKDNTEIPIELTGAYTTYQGKRANVVYIRDITLRKTIEDQLKAHKNHLEGMVNQRTAQLNQEIKRIKWMEDRLKELYELEVKLRAELESQMAQRVDFTRKLVHELKTPLSSLLMASEILMKRENNGQTMEIAKVINDGTIVLNQRIDELMDIAKGEIGLLKLVIAPCNLLSVVKDVSNHTSFLFKSKNQTFKLEILPDNEINIRIDAMRIRQVLTNLLDNASKYTRRNGNITLRVNKEQDNVKIEIQDTGLGITPEEQLLIFRPYYGAISKNRQRRSLGLGLPLSKMIVELHGGQLWVQSEKGKGSLFAFSLPTGSKAI